MPSRQRNKEIQRSSSGGHRKYHAHCSMELTECTVLIDVLAQQPLEIGRLRHGWTALASVMSWRHEEPQTCAMQY